MNADRLKRLLTKHEDRRAKPYRDSLGKLTIGIGRNLDDRGLSDAEIDFLFANDIASVQRDLTANLPWVKTLDDTRQCVFADMCFNLGISRLLGFRNMLAAAQRGDFATAANEMLNSQWAHQVGARATELANLMRLGDAAAGAK
jgi:lysozyme